MPQRTVTLLLSGVDKHLPADGNWPTLPAFQTLLSKGEREACVKDPVEYLFELFHLSAETGADRPAGAISALGDGLDSASGWWLRADPVHMVADRDQLYLSAAESLGLSQGEANALIDELNKLYAEDGWQFYAVTPQRWYLRLPQSLAMRTIATASAMGSRVGEVLPQGEDALVWQRVMTEIQMQLHTSPVNAERSEQGQLAVNSLWFWGGGELPATKCHPGVDVVVGTDPLGQGLARYCGVDAEVGEVLSGDTVGKGNSVLWQTAMQSPEHAEQHVFTPLLAMLRDGVIDELEIVLPGFSQWRIGRKALRRWWRRPKPFAELLTGNA